VDTAIVGRLLDVALAAIAFEIVGLVAYRWITGRGLRPIDTMGQLLAGAFLLAAVRAAVAQADLRVVLLLVTASLPTHLFDLVRRVRASQTK